ncbi:hypothetical protein QFW82_11970 [Streptomyces malaysiensis subsp. malaysiensis]|uniref:hypothetical protein n=1 Tax=Streptomyces malaysiensis TaxID=92644 RepID=UPI0024BFEB4A|nr:hypothetical protein [Streptomyces sp. NA07423]WHX17712.1 hypothetical protein QFW82_11970 [Streptomyces sp. NA07423]
MIRRPRNRHRADHEVVRAGELLEPVGPEALEVHARTRQHQLIQTALALEAIPATTPDDAT